MDIQAIRQMITDDPRLDHAYSQEVRQVVGRYTRRRRDDGASWSQIERELGISCTSAKRWMRGTQTGGFQQVVIAGGAPTSDVKAALVITSPSGFELTGFSFDEAVELMRRLR